MPKTRSTDTTAAGTTARNARSQDLCAREIQPLEVNKAKPWVKTSAAVPVVLKVLAIHFNSACGRRRSRQEEVRREPLSATGWRHPMREMDQVLRGKRDSCLLGCLSYRGAFESFDRACVVRTVFRIDAAAGEHPHPAEVHLGALFEHEYSL